jgi:hypothetical protein
MPTVKCPTCGEKGPITRDLVGMRIKCRKCGTSFQVTAPAAKAAAPAVVGASDSHSPAPARPDGIEVDGLDETAWTGTAVVSVDHDPDHDHVEATSASFTASPHEAGAGAAVKQYKILTSKDKFFDNKFDLARLEDALNHFARHGWVVRSMATPHVAGFSGGPREELVVLLER